MVHLRKQGFPINSTELKRITNRCGRDMSIFKNNLLDENWIKSFMTRHDEFCKKTLNTSERKIGV